MDLDLESIWGTPRLNLRFKIIVKISRLKLKLDVNMDLKDLSDIESENGICLGF